MHEKLLLRTMYVQRGSHFQSMCQLKDVLNFKIDIYNKIKLSFNSAFEIVKYLGDAKPVTA
jgi:hypothetical protein